jgi:hypothetical protein
MPICNDSLPSLCAAPVSGHIPGQNAISSLPTSGRAAVPTRSRVVKVDTHSDSLPGIRSVMDTIDSLGLECSSCREKKKSSNVRVLTTRKI